MNAVAERLRDAHATFAVHPIAFAKLFGSHALGTAGKRSDVDVAVKLGADALADAAGDADAEAGLVDELGAEERLALRLTLARELERATGLSDIEVVVLDDVPLTLAGRVHDHGILVFSSDDVMRVRYDSLISRMYHDFRHHEEQTARLALERMADG